MDEKIDFVNGGGLIVDKSDYWVIRLTLLGMGVDARDVRYDDVDGVLLNDIFVRFSLDERQRKELYKQVLLGRVAREKDGWRRRYLTALARTVMEEEG